MSESQPNQFGNEPTGSTAWLRGGISRSADLPVRSLVLDARHAARLVSRAPAGETAWTGAKSKAAIIDVERMGIAAPDVGSARQRQLVD